MSAARLGLSDTAALLLSHGADLERRDGQGRTALWHAVREENEDVVTLLVEGGARIYYRFSFLL